MAAGLDPTLVTELLAAHAEAKRNFFLGGLRLTAVEGGRFCEAALRLLQQIALGRFEPLGRQLDTDRIARDLQQLPGGSVVESVRLHIPRSIRVVYDIRNKRDAAHLADGIDPNLQDATLVVTVLDWILAELVRLYHKVDANAAQRIVDDIVTRQAPSIQDFDGFLKVLRPDLGASDRVLVLLYQRGVEGASFDQLSEWMAPKMRSNLRRTLNRLEHEKAFVHSAGEVYRITRSGQLDVETRRLVDVNT